ncbi:MAG: 23S rRNA (adenine(2503)-C(2))-methyltransferase RlmN [Spirochaetaceae bacterium]|nr:MAG: 23S rRNA (adenine(2503)-C(2))-methyltransferase RlmN [Spirochaetaceae bacterium]
MATSESENTAARSPSKLLGSTREELRELAVSLGARAYHGDQIYDWIYAKRVTEIDAMTNLPAALRDRLGAEISVGANPPIKVSASTDGTKKYLYATDSGGWVEAAYIPEPNRATLCLSTQVGCKMGCLFCMTGKQGFQAQLDAREIINQYYSLPERENVTNIVYMGMGEPLDNLDATLKSLSLFTDHRGLCLAASRITVSTIGLVPAMRRFLTETQCRLAVSLHSPFADERRKLMPIETVHGLDEVIAVVREFGLSRHRRATFEYIMFDGVNDTDRHARELVKILTGIRCRVNLLAFHPIPGTPLRSSSAERINAFRDALIKRGLMTTIRTSRGLDIAAACGMLSTKELVKAAKDAEPGFDADEY